MCVCKRRELVSREREESEEKDAGEVEDVGEVGEVEEIGQIGEVGQIGGCSDCQHKKNFTSLQDSIDYCTILYISRV